MKRVWMETMPRGDHVYSDAEWLVRAVEQPSFEMSMTATIKIRDTDDVERSLNPKYVIKWWIDESS